MASRTKIAHYLADNLGSDKRQKAIQHVAAWLIANRRKHQANYVASDVAQILAGRGYLQATVTTARPLTDVARRDIEGFLRTSQLANELEIQTDIDPALISGVLIQTPGRQLDATGKSQLQQLVDKASL